MNRVEDGKNWKVFDFCNMFLQTTDELEEATSDILQRLRKENVVYAEIRFCPTLHTLESLTAEEALQSVLKGRVIVHANISKYLYNHFYVSF